ncbi:MAG TPA: Gfo/Idh/MocA family oxidoreductase [Hymenobacter sp.]|uniref:Gfo/Idh/MocA family protein n=1 Tax=Hymenobacter sp. TaxID=1898978 RepID=UPI002D7F9C95|nr:Gfo/Idh/MocA family oxidoreductase [Hymenobacter sp.]HET9504337.1 Gfo/Idh/MocA family oxidoreductase [Hymenobacter sp.]
MPDFRFPTADSRRDFLRTLSLGVGATLLAPSAFALPPERRLGVALVGLGKYSTGQLAPALQQTKLCRLVGIATGSPAKAAKWKEQYQLADKNIYNYKNFDRIIDNPDIDVVYVVTPNALHAEFAVRAAQAGKHVMCEKPMATTVADARHMIAASKKAGKQLSIGYRLHFEPHHQELMRLGQTQAYGKINKLLSDNGFKFNNDTPWRVSKSLAGGGPLMDMGIYCLQGCLYTKGQVPLSVTAKFDQKPDNPLFREVESGMSWQLNFADGSTADCRTSYAENLSGRLRAEAANGWLELQPAFAYGGLAGQTSKTPNPLALPNINQQAAQMDDFAACILHNKPTRVPGEMGLRDVQLLLAIYRAAETGQKIPTNEVQQLIDRTQAK